MCRVFEQEKEKKDFKRHLAQMMRTGRFDQKAKDGGMT